MSVLVEIELVHQQCGKCGVSFGMERTHRKSLMENDGTFYCPNGCCRQFCSENGNAKLKRQLEEAQRKVTETQCRFLAEEQAKVAALNEAERLKKRSHAGVCHCCNRTFQNLARHMKTKHGKDKT
jgi:hypothetical protein